MNNKTTICIYCKCMYRDWCGAKRCGAPSQITGLDHVNGGLSYTGASCLMTNKGDCKEYEPSWWAKLLGLGG